MIYDLIGRDSASPAFDKAGASASRMEKTVSKVSKAIVLAGAAIAGGAVAIGVESVKAATQFQASMERIHTQAGASQADVDSLTKSVLKLAPATEQGPEQLSEALYHLKSIGLDNADAMKALKTASDLAAVGGANLEDTTNALGGAWRSGIKGAQSFGETAATVNAIIGAGNMTMEQFTDAIGTGILPSARSFGVSLKSVGAALALMTDEGIPAQAAATRLRMSLSLLGAPSNVAAKQLATIGITGTQLADAMRGPQGIIGAISLLKSHLDASGLSASQQAALLSRAFGGGRSSSAILTMINNLSVLEKKQKQINDTTGNYGGAVAAQRQTAQAQFDLLKSSLDTLGIRLGLDLLPPVEKFTHWLSTTGITEVAKFTTKVRSIIPVSAIEQDVKKAEQWVKNLFGMGGGETAPKITPRIDLQNEGLFTKTATLKVKPQLDLQNEGLFTKTPVLKVKPQVDIQNEGIFTHTPVLKTSPQIDLQNEGIFTKTAPHVAKKASNSIESMIKSVNWGKVFTSIIDSAISDAQIIGAEFIKLLGKINWTAFGGSLATVVVGLAVGLVNGLVPALISEAIHHPLDMAMFIISLIPIGRAAGILIDIFDKIPFLGPLVKFLLGPIEKAGGLVESALGKMLKKVFGPVGDRIVAAVGDAKSWLLGKGETALLGLWYGAEDGWRVVAGFLGKIGDRVTAPFAKANSWLLSKGSDIISGLGDGIWSAARAIGTWLYKYVWKPVTDYFVQGTSWLLGKGRDIIQGLGSGIWDRAKMIGTWLYKYVWKPLTDYFAKGATWLYQRGSDIIQGLGTGIWNRARSVGSWLYRYIYKPLTGYFAKGGSWLWNHGWDLIQGLFNGITARLKGISSWVSTYITGPIIKFVKSHFGIKSPSTVFHGIGFNMIAGLLRGIIAGDPLGAIKKIFGSAPKALAGLLEHGLISAAKLPGKAISALRGLGSSVLSELGSALGGAGSSVLGLLDKLFGSGGGGGGNAANEALGQKMAAALGWTGNQWSALKSLWMGESGWSATAYNASSGATGIPQSLPGSKMASAGADWRTNPATQIKWGLGYIADVYGNPANAYAKWLARSPHWYAKGLAGQIFSTPTLIGVGEGTRPEKVTVTPLGASYGGSDGATAPLIGQVVISPQEGPTVDEAMGALLFTMRRARQAGFPRR